MPIRDTDFSDDYHVGFNQVKAEKSQFSKPKLSPRAKEYQILPRQRFDGWRPFDIFKAPEVNLETDRRRAILENKPARFKIERNPRATDEKPMHHIDWVGNKAVRTYSKTIERISKKHGMDPDFIKAVMWTENARGHNVGAEYLLKNSDNIKTKMPMNINPKMWSRIINEVPDNVTKNSEKNIEAGVVLLKRIQDRLDDPTPEKIGTLWNGLKAEYTNNIGKTISKAYKEKPWKK